MKHLARLAVIVFSLSLAQAVQAVSWPASTTATVVSTGLPSAYEPSGLAWDDLNNYIYAVSDEGILSRMTSTGSNVTNWPSSGDYNADFEGATVTGINSNVYVGNEDDNSIYEFTSSTSTTSTTLPTKKWSFLDADWTTAQKMINSDNNLGLEGIAYIPAGDWYDYGVFLGLQQLTGTIFVGRPDLNTSGNFTYVSQFTPRSINLSLSHSHPSDLFYSFPEKRLYVLYDDGYVLVLGANAAYITEYTLTGSGQEEGFVLQSNSPDNTVNVYIGIDTPGTINKYSGFPQVYPVTTVDTDSDGAISTVDCNDNDVTISSNRTYYRDVDGDGLGSSTATTSVCSLSAPTGYVTTATDLNDADYDNDGVATSSDCNDADSSIAAYQTYYRDADNDGLGTSATTSVVCSYTVTSGYVTNASDLNDTDYDNDGISTGSDCNDANATLTSYLTVYQDYDGDGLGNPAVSQSICALAVPTGYVTNANDTDDSGIIVIPTPDPEPTYSPIEFLANLIDDDGDGSIDEWNTLASNGVHPIYGSYDANSTGLYTATVASIAGSSGGNIKVTFADGSGYRYKVFNSGSTTVTSSKGTAYLLVKNYNGRKSALVNAYTGAVLDSVKTVRGRTVKVNLRSLTLKLK